MHCIERFILPALLVLPTVVSSAEPGTGADANWGQWRGPSMTGVAPLAKPPVEWSETENVRWKTALPGRGLSTPVIWGDRLFVTSAVEGGAPITPEKLADLQQELPDWVRKQGGRLPNAVHTFVLFALDLETGKTVWKRERDEMTSWSTPVMIEEDGVAQVVVAARGRSRGYRTTNGEILWELGGMTENVIPSPVYGDGLVHLMSGFRGNAMQALRLSEAQGDLTGTEESAVVWTYAGKNTPYTPSPLLYKGLLYFCRRNDAVLSCFGAKTGEVQYEGQPLEGLKGVYASPLGADGRVYLAGRNGACMVIEHGPQFKVLASNRLDDGFDASPVAVGDALYLRGLKHLYCLADE